MDHKDHQRPSIENDQPMLDDEVKPTLDQNDRPMLDGQEETAAEFIDQDQAATQTKEEDQNITSVYGWIAVALSSISLFIVPILLAAAGIIFGVISRSKTAPILGNTAIAIGIISLISHFLIIPMI